MTFYFRSFSTVRRSLEGCGFADLSLEPFHLPIDLRSDGVERGDPDVLEALLSRSLLAASGERLVFRGALCQPWCHARARKPE